MNSTAEKDKREMAALETAFGLFTETTERMVRSHEELKRRVESLTEELAEKNRILTAQVEELNRLRALEQRMHRSERLAALGEMAAGVAHEIRNPLGGIKLYAGLLARALAGNEKERALAEKILAGTSHMDNVVEGMLAFTRDIEPDRRAADLVAVVRQALELAAGAVGESGVEVAVTGDAKVEAQVDAELLRRVFLNVITNACQAMPNGGRLTIELKGEPSGAAQRAVCRFEDTGPGIPEGVIGRLFTPFFTTREDGTGLGLAISQRIVEAHGGEITAANAPRGGAVFTVRI
jgi:signal transduction histidine kinase